jgi:plasmid maintenance system killer protein
VHSHLRGSVSFASMESPALSKLNRLDLSRQTKVLRAPPAKRLGPLKGDCTGRLRLRPKKRLRVRNCWNGSELEDGEIVD